MKRIRYRIFLLALCWFGLALGTQAQSDLLRDAAFVAEAEQGLNLLYNMKFDEANAIFSDLAERHPRHPVGPFLKALNTWWLILSDMSDESHDDRFYKEMDEVVKRANRQLRRNRRSVDAMFFKSVALGFRGRLRSNRGNWFKAAFEAKDAIDYVFDIAEQDPDNADFMFGKGMYDYYADMVPKRYPLAKPAMIFFPGGDRENGIRLLKWAAEEGTFVRAEAVYFLLQIYYLYESDFEQSVTYITWLREAYPDNAFFHAIEGRVYARWAHWDTSATIFADILERHDAGQTGYNQALAEQALYYLGRSRMMTRDFTEALTHFERLEAAAIQNRDSYYKVLGRLRQGMSYDVLGRRPEAEAAYRAVLDMEAYDESRDRANAYLRTPYRVQG